LVSDTAGAAAPERSHSYYLAATEQSSGLVSITPSSRQPWTSNRHRLQAWPPPGIKPLDERSSLSQIVDMKRRLSPTMEYALAAMNARSQAELEQVDRLAHFGFYGGQDLGPEPATAALALDRVAREG
jgi:hypothetical protein